MKKMLISLTIVGLFLVLFLPSLSIYAQSEGPGRNYSDEELQQMAERVVFGKSSDTYFDDIKLTEEDFWTLAEFVLVFRGISDEERNNLLKGTWYEQQEWINNLEHSQIIFWGPCSQMVEEEGAYDQTAASVVFASWDCDGDSSDQDWQFQFSMYWFGDPDEVRWWSQDWWVRTVFEQVYAGQLLGNSLCSYPKYMCLGTNGVALAGGVDNVKTHLRIAHK